MARKRGTKVCSAVGCPVLVVNGVQFCVDHQREARARNRSLFDALYSTKRWRVVRLRVLRRARYRCAVEGCPTWANEVDHVVPLIAWRGSPFDEANLQALCASHHASKTARETWGDGR